MVEQTHVAALPRSRFPRHRTRFATQEGDAPIYLQLATLLERLIRQRALRPGDRMPSVRQLSAQQRVSVPTALQAYATLETRGLVEARPKSGFFVRVNRTELPPPRGASGKFQITDFSHTDPFASLLADFGASDLVPLGGAVPGGELLPGAKLARTMASIARTSRSAGNTYDMPPGSENLRREIARRSLTWGGALKTDDILITIGGTEALSLALRVTCSPGDTVAVESPTYFGLARMLREMRLKALPIPVDSAHGMDLDHLRAALRRTRVAACISNPNFQNPVGFLMPDERKRELVTLLAERDIPLIEDDAYGDLQHQGVRPPCLKAFDTDERVILCGSFSKVLAPGYRIGYVAGGRWHARIVALKHVTTLGCPTLPTLAIAEFLRNGGYERYLRSVRQAYRHQVERMRFAVAETFPSGTRLSQPRGSFLLWCELPPVVDSLTLAKEARQAGISIAPGPLFSPENGFRNYIRLNAGYAWNERIERAIGVLGHLVGRLSR